MINARSKRFSVKEVNGFLVGGGGRGGGEGGGGRGVGGGSDSSSSLSGVEIFKRDRRASCAVFSNGGRSSSAGDLHWLRRKAEDYNFVEEDRSVVKVVEAEEEEDDEEDFAGGGGGGWRRRVRCRPWSCTMEVFSILKHSMGSDEVNPITKHFTIGRQTGSAGTEMVWKIYEATRNEDKKEASVFVFEKRIADKLHKPRRREVVAETLRKDVGHLERLRHPKILTVLHGVEECHDSVAFATEPVYASLANVLGNHERLPANTPIDIKDHSFIELEIKHGIVQITEALSYLHNHERLIHCNVCPQCVVLTRRGSWKLLGFGFAEKIKDGKEGSAGQAWSTKIPKMAQPDLNFMAPEIQLGKTCSPLSDMFSVGMVICAIYNSGRSLINAEHSPNLYVKQLDQMHESFGIVAHRMPLQLVEPVEKMINKDLKYFNDPVVISLHGMDMYDKRDPAQKVEAYSSLSQAVPNIPLKILHQYVLPELLGECKSCDSIIFALPTLFTIIDYAARQDYADLIMPDFRAILANTRPVQATVYILNKLDIILSKSPIEEIKGEVLPFVFSTLDSSSLQSQEAALGAIGAIKEYLDDNILRKMVLPKAKSLFFRSNNVKIRINALTCIDHLLNSLDKMLILDNILPFMANISAQDPDVVMCIVGIYKHMLSDKKFGLTHNLIATKVMPSLIPHTVNPGLSLEQFSGLMEVLREMLDQIDKQRRDKMKQETLSYPVPPRGSIKMVTTENGNDDTLSSSHHEILLECQRKQQLQKTQKSPGTPEQTRSKIIASPKAAKKNQSLQSLGMSLEEKATLDKPIQSIRRHSLVPPSSSSSSSSNPSNNSTSNGLGSHHGPLHSHSHSNTNPTISITTEDASPDRTRRSSTHSLGPFSVSGITDLITRGCNSVSSGVCGDKTSGAHSSSYRRPSIAGMLPLSPADSRRPSTHSVGILPISMFGEGGEKPRRPSTHSLGVFPFGCFGDEKPEKPRRCSAHSLGPMVVPDLDRRGSRGSIFGNLGIGDFNITSSSPSSSSHHNQRRPSFQAFGESVMQLFGNK